MYFETNSKRDK